MARKTLHRVASAAILILLTAGVRAESTPDFALPSLADGNQRLSEYRSEVVVVTFLSPGCLPCRDSVRFVTELRDEVTEGLSVLAVTVADDPAFARGFVRKLDIDFPMLLDREGEAAAQFDLNRSSMTVVLDQEGNIVFLEEGFAPESSDRIRQLVSGLLAA